MKVTSAEASKILKKFQDEYAAVLDKESISKEFVAAISEDIETVRPDYDYLSTQEELARIEEKIRNVKHAINVFNSTHTVPGFDMTVDEILVYIPQLTRRINKLADMKSKLPKMRVDSFSSKHSNIIDYTYANYDISIAAADYDKASSELAKAQLALDKLNTSETFELNV